MAPSERPVATSFFPATRLGLFVGFVIALVGAFLLRAQARSKDVPIELPLPTASTTARAPSEGTPGVLRGPVIAHVWLENCADCMPAFEAHKALVESGALRDLPIVNVGYGGSTPEFRARYHLEQGYFPDADGSRVVNRYGISSFTTLVLDANHALLFRGRPDAPGYLEGLQSAWRLAR